MPIHSPVIGHWMASHTLYVPPWDEASTMLGLTCLSLLVGMKTSPIRKPIPLPPELTKPYFLNLVDN